MLYHRRHAQAGRWANVPSVRMVPEIGSLTMITAQEFDEWIRQALFVVMMVVATKAMLGYRFPWEVCDCCKRKIREHRK